MRRGRHSNTSQSINASAPRQELDRSGPGQPYFNRQARLCIAPTRGMSIQDQSCKDDLPYSMHHRFSPIEVAQAPPVCVQQAQSWQARLDTYARHHTVLALRFYSFVDICQNILSDAMQAEHTPIGFKCYCRMNDRISDATSVNNILSSVREMTEQLAAPLCTEMERAECPTQSFPLPLKRDPIVRQATGLAITLRFNPPFPEQSLKQQGRWAFMWF